MRLQEKLSSMLDKISCYCRTHDAEKYSEDDIITKLQVHQLGYRFQQTGSVIRIANTTSRQIVHHEVMRKIVEGLGQIHQDSTNIPLVIQIPSPVLRYPQ